MPYVIQHGVAGVAHKRTDKLQRCNFLAVLLQAQRNIVVACEVYEWWHELLLNVSLFVSLSLVHANRAGSSRTTLLLAR